MIAALWEQWVRIVLLLLLPALFWIRARAAADFADGGRCSEERSKAAIKESLTEGAIVLALLMIWIWA